MINKLKQLIAEAKGTCDDTRTFEEVIAEHLLSHGVLMLPCKFGQTVYVICNTSERIELGLTDCIYQTKIDHISIGAKGAEFHILYRWITHPDCDWFTEKDIGKTVFFTRKEAEQVLKGTEQ